jgi:predicted ribosomally synthesized peptide with SipW-like signal peptide
MKEENGKLALSRRQILGGVGAAGAAGAGAGLGTSALFSDVESFDDNSITAGTLDMTVDAEIVAANEYYTSSGSGPDIIGQMGTADGAAVVGLQAGDVKPGDWVIVCFEITIEDNPGYVLVQANNLESDENGFEEPEPEDGAPDGEGELDDKLLTTVWDDYDDSGTRSGLSTLDIVTNNAASSYPDPPSTNHSWDSGRNEGGEVDSDVHYTTFRETHDEWFEDGFLLGPGPDTDASKIGGPGNDQESKVVYLLLEVPEEVGNEIQGDSISFDLEFRAEQVRNNDDPFPGPVINARTGNEFDNLQDAVDAAQQGDTIQVREGASFDESIDLGVKNLTLEAISNTKPTIEQGVDITAEGVTIDGFEITNAGGKGVEVRGAGASNLTITNSVVTNNGEEGIDVFAGTVGDISITNSVIDDNGGTGLFIGGPFGSGTFVGPGVPISVAGPIQVENVSASNNAFDGILVSSGTVSALTLRNVDASNNGNDGIDVDGVAVSNSIIARVTAANNGGGGLVAGSLFSDAVVTGRFERLLVDNNGAAGGFSGVEVFDGTDPATDVEVDRSELVDNAGFGAFTDDGDPRSGVDADVFLSNISLSGNEVAPDGDQVSEGVKIESTGAPSDVGADLN